MSSGKHAAIGIVTLLIVAGCLSGPVPTSSPSGTPSGGPSDGVPTGEVRVVLGIYSGRPDPEWTLTGAEVAALDRAIAALPDASGTPQAGDLGYHGFTVTRPGSTFVAYLGTVAPAGNGPRAFKLDRGLVVERLLLETGRPHLAAAEVAEVERALAAVP